MRADHLLHSRVLRFALSPVLAPASLLYALGLAFDRSRKSVRRRRLAAPVISVGNLTLGGTGKTPVVMKLLLDLRTLGRKPAVLTRGYAGAGVRRKEGILSPGSDSAGYSDEVRLMADRCPFAAIGVGADRASAADGLLRLGAADTFVLDDGFQHWALDRTLDVVCIDVSRSWERFLLPLGLLREPASALSRAQVILLTRCELAAPSKIDAVEERVRRLAPAAQILRTFFDMRLADAAGGVVAGGSGPVVALSAIGHPDGFEAALSGLGFAVHPMRFPDHHAYGAADLTVIVDAATRSRAAVVTTAKDWVKLRAAGWPDLREAPSLWIAEQTLRFGDDGENIWAKAIGGAVRS